MTVLTNGYVENPLTANEIRKVIEHLSQIAENLESDNLIHVSGSISIELPSEPKALTMVDKQIKCEKTQKVIFLSDAEFMVKE